MKAVAIDIGNTKIKVGSFDSGTQIEILEVSDLPSLQKVLTRLAPDRVISCSVAYSVTEQEAYLSNHDVLYMSHDTPLPLQNLYSTKETLGLDRLAAVVGAQTVGNLCGRLVIDIGTCITYDFLDRDNNYHGGAISPGIALRFKAMHDYTKRLPLIEEYDEVDLIGHSTRSAMTSGVIHGISAEIDGIISRYKQKWPDIQVILCGGGAKRFESKLKESIFASPELVLVGLNRILEYNEDKK
ncbi:type III pantothenate kinase [Reichenbachiella sp. MSK19-1]|uniref:type III pantothenate kinase n=1 Tax=Reichenbachiella sp. MSK19-1 TaxID=1897631 RepID=UPI000E6BDAB5|nr:type III pantothenate kinase [Reichenbachiella sp. MSK19-1]RJE71435.1 hypothetical protein BGP76_04870 [Reichenbachiella sp. MSK19-1]